MADGKADEPKEPKKKGRNQTGMKVLLGLLVLFAIPGGWLTYKVKAQRKAIEWVTEAGGDVMYDIELGDKGQFLQPDELAAQPNAWMLSFLGKDYVSGVGSVLIPEGSVSDLSPIAGFGDLQELSIARNKVTDVSVVTKMPELKIINLEGNPISDLSAMSGLSKLNKLTISKTEVENLSPLKDSALELLNISDTAVADLSPLKGSAIKTLNLDRTKVADVSALADVQSLTHLYLSGTPVADLTPLKGLTNIEQLNLSGTKVLDLSPLYGMSKLDGLTVWETEIDEAQIKALNEKLPKVRVLTVKRSVGGR